MNVSITNGTVLFYGDLRITNASKISSMILEIHFTGLVLKDLELYLWAYNMSGNNEWDLAPPEATDMYTYDYLTNTLLVNFTGIPSSVIFAISYVILSQPAIPAYPLTIFFSVSILAVIALSLTIRKKYKYKF